MNVINKLNQWPLKKYFSKNIFLLFMILLSCKGENITYINPNKLLQGYHGATTQHELFQAKARDWQLRIDSLGTELQALSQARFSSYLPLT